MNRLEKVLNAFGIGLGIFMAGLIIFNVIYYGIQNTACFEF